METIDCTPTWRAIMPALVQAAANGETPEGRKTAMDELLRLADIVDKMNAQNKAGQFLAKQGIKVMFGGGFVRRYPDSGMLLLRA